MDIVIDDDDVDGDLWGDFGSLLAFCAEKRRTD
jgi:hypothetical protein